MSKRGIQLKVVDVQAAFARLGVDGLALAHVEVSR